MALDGFCNTYHEIRPAEIDWGVRSGCDPVAEMKNSLFCKDGSGAIHPVWPLVVQVQRNIVNSYVTRYRIPMERMVEFWCTYVDLLLRCPAFEEKASDEFRAWAYGRMCRYVLMERTAGGAANPPICKTK